MRPLTSLSLAILFLSLAGCSGGGGEKAIEGTWLATDAQKEGKYHNDPVDAKMTISLSNGKVTGHMIDGGKREISGTYELNMKAKPPEIDLKLSMDGRRNLNLVGVFELDGDTLTIGTAKAGASRPKEAVSKAGSQSEHIVFKRVKE